ncbi:MAG: hypothetical protein ABIF19_17240 [Planctomycetota bacterium]
MKPDENIEKFVKDAKPHVTTGRPMDKRTLDDSYAAMQETLRAKSAARKPGLPGMILGSRAVQLAAAAAVVIAAVSLFLGRGGHTPTGPTAEPRWAAESPAKMVSMMSLRAAYRQGGLDALDEQFRDTLNVLGPPPLGISSRELLENVN